MRNAADAVLHMRSTWGEGASQDERVNDRRGLLSTYLANTWTIQPAPLCVSAATRAATVYQQRSAAAAVAYGMLLLHAQKCTRLAGELLDVCWPTSPGAGEGERSATPKRFRAASDRPPKSTPTPPADPRVDDDINTPTCEESWTGVGCTGVEEGRCRGRFEQAVVWV